MPTRIHFTGGDPIEVENDIEDVNDKLLVAGTRRVAFEVVNGGRTFVNPDAVAYLITGKAPRSGRLETF